MTSRIPFTSCLLLLSAWLSSSPVQAQSYNYNLNFIGPGTVYAGQNLYLEGVPAWTGTAYPISFDSAQLSGQSIAFEAYCGAPDCPRDIRGVYPQLYPGGNVVIRIAIPANAVPGGYTWSLVTESQGVSHSYSSTVQVLAAPAPLPAAPALPQIAVPILNTWQNTMLQLAPTWCPTGPLDFSNEQQVWYYDGARTYFEIADYTGNKTWETCAFAIARQYRDAVISFNGGLPGWRNFTRGLRLAYERSGDASYQKAVILLSQNAAFADRAGDVSDEAIRETSYVLNSYIEAERAGAPRNPLLGRAADYLIGHFSRLFVTHTYIINQTFFDGIGAEALINYYELTKDPRVPPVIKTMLDWMWTYGYNHSTHQMVYNPDPAGPTCSVGCQSYGTDYINLIVPAFGWYWSVTGDATYQQEGDEIFSHSLDTTINYSAKIFNQNYRWSYVAYRAVNAVAPPAPPAAFTPIRVNAGGGSFTDASGNVWASDTGSNGGGTYSTNNPIIATTAPSLYQSERYSGSILQYDFAVPNGSYTVNLKFAEIWFSAPGQRVFNIVINGQQVQANFDAVAQAGSWMKAVDKSYTVNVTTGHVTIQLVPVISNPKISAIEILGIAGTPAPVPPPPPSAFAPIRVNAGGGSFTDASGNIWASETGSNGGGTYAVGNTIAGTASQVLYQSERYSTSTLQYDFAVPNGSHTVNLKFAEIWFGSTGQRVCNILINGQLVETNFDAVAQAGGPMKPIDKSYTVNVTGGHVTIQLVPVISNPKISAIEIL